MFNFVYRNWFEISVKKGDAVLIHKCNNGEFLGLDFIV